VWVLSNRGILFGHHRVVAGRMAVGFVAAAMGAFMIPIATSRLVRAKRRVAELSKRRDELEEQLGRRYQ
jgi:hypothetical protein